MVLNKNGSYALYLWVSAVLLIVVSIILPDYLDSTTEFILLFMDFFGFLAILFAIFYSFLAIEAIVKEKKKKKRIVSKNE